MLNELKLCNYCYLGPFLVMKKMYEELNVIRQVLSMFWNKNKLTSLKILRCLIAQNKKTMFQAEAVISICRVKYCILGCLDSSLWHILSGYLKKRYSTFWTFPLDLMWAREINKQKMIITIYKEFLGTCIESKKQHIGNWKFSKLAVLKHSALKHVKESFPKLYSSPKVANKFSRAKV